MSKSRDAIEAQRTALSAVSIGSSVQAYDADTAKLDVEQTYTATQTFGTVAVTGNVDGRDVSVDGAKLDGIEANATADQTGAQIKTAYQAETNAFTDAQFTKLAGVEASANNYTHPSNHAISVVTGLQAALDAKVDDSQVLTNVPSGALFTDTVYTHPANHAISVVTGLQTALDAALPKAGGALTGAVTTNSTFDGRDVSVDGTKLDTITIGTTVQAYDADTAKTDVVQTYTASQIGEVTALTDASSIATDLALSNNFAITLGGNRTLANPTNITAGQSGSIFITQDGTGSRTLAFGANFKFVGGTAPTLSTAAASVDRIDYVVAEATKIHAVASLDVK